MTKQTVYTDEQERPAPLVEEPNLFEQFSHPTENIDLNYSARSLLRYPGGKTRGVEFITRFFPKNLETLLSPFFGGGSIELAVAARGTMVYGYDLFQPLVEFWQCLQSHPLALAEAVQLFFPLSKERFYQLQQTQTQFESPIQRAAVFYVLNRSSFSGSTLSGGMSPEHPRFTPTSIERLRNFYNPNIQVEQSHFLDSLAKHPYTFAYLDPPYLIKSSLYGKKGDAHKDFDHQALAYALKHRKNWLMSYNDCEEIRDLYHGLHLITPNWKYGMSNDKTSKEVLIFSHNFNLNGHFNH